MNHGNHYNVEILNAFLYLFYIMLLLILYLFNIFINAGKLIAHCGNYEKMTLKNI